MSSCGCESGSEGGWFVVVLAGLEAVVEAAEHAVEGVAERAGVSVADLAAVVVVGSGAGGFEGRERSHVAGGGQPLVLDLAVMDHGGLAGRAGDRCCSGVGLEGAGVGEPVAVVADLGQDSGAGQVGESGEAGDDGGVGMLVEGVGGGFGEVGSTRSLARRSFERSRPTKPY